MFKFSHAASVVVMAAVVMLLSSAVTAPRASAAPPSVPPPQVTIKATDDALDAPAQLEAGIVAITFQNNGTKNHNLKFYRLKPGKTADDFKSASSFTEAIGLSDASYGGTSTNSPGQTLSVVLDLAEGQYVVASFLRGPPDIKTALTKALTVVPRTSPGTVDEPKADLSVSLRDNTIALPTNIVSGTHTFKITNDGTNYYQVILVKIASGKSNDDVTAWLKANQAGPAPVDNTADYGGTAELSPGKRAWLTLHLTPGGWFAFNNVPGTNYNVPVFITVGAAPTTAPATGGVDHRSVYLRVAFLLGMVLIALGWFVRRDVAAG